MIDKNELGIDVKCNNCYLKYDCNLPVENACRINGQYLSFMPSIEASSNRIRALQEIVFTKEEAEKMVTFLTHGYKMMINENKDIFSKLKKMKGEQ